MEQTNVVATQSNGKKTLRNMSIGAFLFALVSPAFAVVDPAAAAKTISDGGSATDTVILALVGLAAGIYIGKTIIGLVRR